MAKFNNAYLTDAGAELLAKIIADGAKIEFLEMVFGEGVYTEEEKRKENLRKRTELKTKRQGMPFSSVSATKENAVKLKAIVSNEEITDGYRMTEIGIIAKQSGDETSNGILYSIVIAEEPDYIPSKDNPITYIQEYYTKVGNAEQVEIKVENGVYALAEDLTAHINNMDNPHQVTKSHVGLGNVDNTADSEKPVSKEQQSAIDEKYKMANAYTNEKVAQLVNGAPETLDTLKEVADAMAQNKDVVDALNQAIGTKADNGHTHDDRYYTEAEVNNFLAGKQDKGTVLMHERTASNAWIPGNGNQVTLAYIDVTPGAYLLIGQLIVPIDTNNGSVSAAVSDRESFADTNVYAEHPFKSGAYVTANMSYAVNVTQSKRFFFIAKQTSGVDTQGGRYYFQVVRLSV